MPARKWPSAVALFAASAAVAGGQPAAGPPPVIDPVAVEGFLRGKGVYGRLDPAQNWEHGPHGTINDVGLVFLDWVVRREGLPAFFFDRLPAGEAALPRPAAPFAVVVREEMPTAAQLGRFAGLEQLHTLCLPTRGGDNGPPSPRAMKQLAALTQLRALSTRVPAGDGAAPLAALTRLRRLDLHLSDAADTDLRPLAALGELRRLALRAPGRPEDGLAHVGRLRQLETLELHGLHLKGDGLKHLAGAARLTRLELHATTVTDAGIAPLGGLGQLHTLRLKDVTDVRESTFLALARLHNLRRLELRRQHPSPTEGVARGRSWLRHLAGLDRLDWLDLSGSWFAGDDSLADVAALRGLKHLDLADPPGFGDAGLARLAGLENLESLDLSRNRALTGAGLKPLAGLRKLRTLNLRGCDGLTPEGVAHLAALPALEHLDVGEWWFTARPLTGDHTAALARAKGLRSLKLDRTRGITDIMLQAPGALDRLEELDVSSNHRLTGAGLVHLARLKHLHTLRFAGCGDGEPLDLTALPRLTGLRTLDLARSRVGDEGLAAIAGVPGLERLVINDTDSVFTAAGLKHLGGLKSLRELDFAARREQIVGAAEVVGGLTGLRALTLHAYSGAGDAPPPAGGLRHLTRLTGLRSLVLLVGPIADENLTHLLGLKQLETLVIFGRVSPAGLARLRDGLPNTLVVIDGRE